MPFSVVNFDRLDGIVINSKNLSNFETFYRKKLYGISSAELLKYLKIRITILLINVFSLAFKYNTTY